MDPMSPIYPPFSPSQTPEVNEHEASDSRNFPRLHPPEASADQDPSAASHAPAAPSLPGLGPFSPPPAAQSQQHPYSPTRAEIESHPIQQRLSLASDAITPPNGIARKVPDESKLEESSNEELLEESRQAHEGSERLFDSMSSDAKNVKEGDAVSYAWGGGRPGGTVTDVQTNDDVKMETKRGNEVKKHGESENPAVYIDRGSDHDVVKKASEITIEEKGKGGSDSAEKKENGEAKTGEKRAAEESAEDKKDEETEGKAKKQKPNGKANAAAKQNGEQPKKKGRPAKTDAEGKPVAKKETKKRAPKKAATESGEPRRSGRHANK